jgi:hypothetical protein
MDIPPPLHGYLSTRVGVTPYKNRLHITISFYHHIAYGYDVMTSVASYEFHTLLFFAHINIHRDIEHCEHWYIIIARMHKQFLS